MSRHTARLSILVLLAAILLLIGCATPSPQRLAGSLSRAMLNQDDPATVQMGASAYLLLLDGLIDERPTDQTLLIAGARLYGAYAMALAQDGERARRLSARARAYARRALCGVQPDICAHEPRPHAEFIPYVQAVGSGDLDALYTYAMAWAGWIQARGDDWNALADLSKVESVLKQVAALDARHDRGRVQLYLGVLRSQLPPALGGQPETGRAHFERAIEYSQGRDLWAKVEFARRYARLVFDRELHDRLLGEVLAADPVEPELTLSNVLAQQQARALLADDYF